MQTNHATTVTAMSTELPVSLSEAKTHLRLLNGDLDEEVQSALEAATEWCEANVGRSLRGSTTLTQTYAYWPCDPIAFDREPVSAITSVTYYDENGDSQTLASSNYRLHKQSESASRLEWDDDFTRPALASRNDAVTITYTAGYTDIASVPATAKHAVKLALKLFFGDLAERDYENTRRSCCDLLRSIDWGFYR